MDNPNALEGHFFFCNSHLSEQVKISLIFFFLSLFFFLFVFLFALFWLVGWLFCFGVLLFGLVLVLFVCFCCCLFVLIGVFGVVFFK